MSRVATRISLNELATVVREKVGRGLPPTYEPERVGDVKHSLGHYRPGAAADRVSSPDVGFADGIERTVEWYRDNIGSSVDRP